MKAHIIIFGLALSAASAQQPADMRTLLEAALDGPARISLKDVKLGALLDALDKETGVSVRIGPQNVALLPHGSETVFTQAEFGNMSIREGLTGLFNGLGMKIEVRRDYVEVVPRPALLRIGRRAAWSELETLQQLSGAALQSDADIEALRPRVQFQIPQQQPWDQLAAAIKDVGAGRGDEVLDIACAHLGWSWFPQYKHVVIVPIQAAYERQLQFVVNVRRESRPFTAVVEEIGRQCGLPVFVDPSALAALKPAVRQSVLYSSEGFSARDAFTELAAQTRLSFVVTEDGVVFFDPAGGRPAPILSAPSPPSAASPAPAQNDVIIGMIPVMLSNGQVVHIMLRESDLPPDLRDEIKRRKIDVVNTLRSALTQP